jgi:ABC-type multidrug transport system fused ATPase/permease subunit
MATVAFAGVLPFRITFGEIMGSLSVSLRQKLADTEHFDLTELMGSLDSRSSFASTRLTGREKVLQEKFAVVMGRWQRNQLKIRSVQQLTAPIISMMRTFAQMAGYYFGGYMVAEGTITPADLVTFVDESQNLVNSVRTWISTWSEMYKDRRDPILLARFNAVVPTIGLAGSRSDGFKYVIPKMVASEFIWTIECRDVTFW